VLAVRWYLRYGRWVRTFTPLPADAARFARHSPGDRWFVDETYVKVAGVWRYVYRAVDHLRSRNTIERADTCHAQLSKGKRRAQNEIVKCWYRWSDRPPLLAKP
jgi:hypothetical protein